MLNDIEKLRFYAHKVLPLVYDDSLSYYEVLCKVVAKLNEVIALADSQNSAIEDIIQDVEDFEAETNRKYEEFTQHIDDTIDGFMQDEMTQREKFEDNMIERADNFEDSITDQQDNFETDMLARFTAFLNTYQRTFGIVDAFGQSRTEAISQRAVSQLVDYTNGTNLLDMENIASAKILDQNGELADGTSAVFTTDYVEASANDVFTLQVDISGTRSDSHDWDTSVRTAFAFACAYSAIGEFISGSYSNTLSYYTCPAGTAYVRFSIGTYLTTGDYSDLALVKNAGSTIYPYEQYGEQSVVIKESVLPSEITNKINLIDKSIYSINIYDEIHNSVVQTDPQYTIGTIYLNGYTGNLTISCKYSPPSNMSYVTNIIVYNSNDEDMQVEVGSAHFNRDSSRQGKTLVIPNGASYITFKYRTQYSQGELVKEMMGSYGSDVPNYYDEYQESNVLENSFYATEKDIISNKIAYVSTNGNDENDGLTFDTAFASIKKALSVARTIFVERGTYTSALNIDGMNNIKLFAYPCNETYAHTSPHREKVVLDRTSGNISSIQFLNCNNLYIEDFIFKGYQSSVYFRNCNNVHLVNCEANESTVNMGFDCVNTNITFDKCRAYGNHIDGFNFHGYGCSFMNDCLAEDNDDDGCSHHDGCVGCINGGQFVNSGKAGIAPAYGAQVNINNAYCKGNNKGIAYFSTNNGHASMKGQINSCAMTDNNYGLQVDELCTVVAINCKYLNNTTQDKYIRGTLTEI